MSDGEGPGAAAASGGAPWACMLLEGTPQERLADLQVTLATRPAGSDLDRRDDRGRLVSVILDGWACRQVSTLDGRRQIVGFIIGADGQAGTWTAPSGEREPVVRTLTACRVLTLRAGVLLALAQEHPQIGARLARSAQIERSRLHASLFNVGQRKARERIAYLLCDLAERASAAGEGDGGFWLPLKQQDIADALGMTSVHVNRVLQRFRAQGLVQIRKGAARIADRAALAQLCDYAQVAFDE
ncbi:MAG TPA: Crp/Fnr family transcriptional regulator [Caulobacteraceae bacterium]|nr:Crp/Fnr family transcriptional regulator [Caulobacteraceae bacterium]